MSSREKLTRLLELGAWRRQSRWPEYGCIGDYQDGAYESDFVSPYTKSAKNVDADVFVLLQDWSSHEWLNGPLHRQVQQLGRMPSLPTNRNLESLLRRHLSLELADVYATNLFPFVKRGSMTSAIPRRDLIRSAREFALPQIDIVQPKLVICLGKACFNALAMATEHVPAPTLSFAIDHPFAYQNARVWCQAHTGAVGRNMRNRGNVHRVDEDWAQMTHIFKTTAGASSQRRPPNSA